MKLIFVHGTVCHQTQKLNFQEFACSLEEVHPFLSMVAVQVGPIWRFYKLIILTTDTLIQNLSIFSKKHTDKTKVWGYDNLQLIKVKFITEIWHFIWLTHYSPICWINYIRQCAILIRLWIWLCSSWKKV